MHKARGPLVPGTRSFVLKPKVVRRAPETAVPGLYERFERERLLGGVAGFDDRAAHVVAAIRADHVRRDGRAALRAVMQLLRLLLIVGPAGTGAGITLTALWYGHDKHQDKTETLGRNSDTANRCHKGKPTNLEGACRGVKAANLAETTANSAILAAISRPSATPARAKRGVRPIGTTRPACRTAKRRSSRRKPCENTAESREFLTYN
jgi:hypothetical protein